jgi:flagellar biosynthetic protein FlhB
LKKTWGRFFRFLPFKNGGEALSILSNIPNTTSLQLCHVNLQQFADEDKTEKATPKKRQDARKKGQVFQSKDLSAAIVLISIVMTLRIYGSYMYYEIYGFFHKVMGEFLDIENRLEIHDVMRFYQELFMVFLKVLLPMFGVTVIMAIAVQLAQIGILFTTETLGFKLEKINPLKGFKRIFSLNSLVELMKSIIKIGIIGYVGYAYINQRSVEIMNMMDMDIFSIAVLMMELVLSVAIRMTGVLFIIGILDYGYQWWSYEKNLKMSKKEIKDEYKQQEGNPEVKSKIKQKQKQMSMQRMMQEVPKADVVITNPTHFAVAIKYDSSKSEAPFVVAKGQDYLAQRLKEIAKKNRVYVAENKPLARALYDSVDIGKNIPEDLYQAVAEILAFVYKMKGKAG